MGVNWISKCVAGVVLLGCFTSVAGIRIEKRQSRLGKGGKGEWRGKGKGSCHGGEFMLDYQQSPAEQRPDYLFLHSTGFLLNLLRIFT